MLKLADTLLILINPSPSNVKDVGLYTARRFVSNMYSKIGNLDPGIIIKALVP